MQASNLIKSASQWQRQFSGRADNIESSVRSMLENIRQHGDAAINQYSQEFDQLQPKSIPLKAFDDYDLDVTLKQSIKQAAKRIKAFARFQKDDLGSRSFSDEYGEFGQVVKPIERAGCYIPGGRFPLISTALMTLIPAKVAGCAERIAVSPVADPAILAAAALAGATQFYQIGGVQAVAALAFGYADLEPVDVIVGPGNAYVNEAKAQLQRQIKIDGLAGPSELLALCDGKTSIEWIILDALAQSEHDPMAQSVIVSCDGDWLTQLALRLLEETRYLELINSEQIVLIQAEDRDQQIDFCNRYAPEHLMLCDENITPDDLTHYGSLFIGANSAVAMGDYCSGPNHTLPTMGYARQSGGLNVQTFLRTQTIQKVNDYGRQQLAQLAMPIAQAEGLSFHYESLAIRAKN
ncbi:MAG: histidinol dehydrogenase [Gammaproteobacteria bacterium]|nr:histidinol dehydrogenase [Gammaproteobacteria bacterium]NVK89550.1 histidinol dehydrogenase [Gammaproteobacteria bacterium]